MLNDSLFSSALGAIVADICREEDITLGPAAIFAYAQGPRTKTAAENRFLAAVGAKVNSMTLAPEVVLANELEIATAGLVTGHKSSVPGRDSARRATERVIRRFLERTDVVPFTNHIYRFENRL